MEKMKILAIGNSFSQDATSQIEQLTDKIFVRNLYIGGCSLEKHIDMCLTEEKAYEYQKECTKIGEFISIKEAILKENWDYITIQQCSCDSGKIDTYYPYIKQLIKYIKSLSKTEIVFHQTWAYEKNFCGLADYNNNQDFMESKIEQTSNEIAKRENLKVIQCGNFIQKLRKYPLFDIEKGGKSLNRDGLHLNLDYGRIAAASIWIKFFTGEIPKLLKQENISEEYRLIYKVLKEI